MKFKANRKQAEGSSGLQLDQPIGKQDDYKEFPKPQEAAIHRTHSMMQQLHFLKNKYNKYEIQYSSRSNTATKKNANNSYKGVLEQE